MRSLRERQLAEHLKEVLVGVQKSQQIYDKLSKWQKKALHLSEKEIVNAANLIASNVEKYYVQREKAGDPLTPDEVKNKLAEELEKFSK